MKDSLITTENLLEDLKSLAFYTQFVTYENSIHKSSKKLNEKLNKLIKYVENNKVEKYLDENYLEEG